MNRKFLKLILFSVLTVFVLSASWYFFKPYDLTVTFNYKTLPGTINQTVKSWSTSLKESKITESESIHSIKQHIDFEDTSHIYDWQFIRENDSITKISVGIIDTKSNFKTRLVGLFQNSDLSERSEKTIKSFTKVLEDHLEAHDVKIDGESMSPSTYCAYIPIKTEQFKKAKGMMLNYGLLSTVLLENNIKLNGSPIIEIVDWDMKTDSIHYNFCFPIVQQDSLPKHPSIKFKKLDGKKSIKATYHGNYISSDRAWYALLDYAEQNSIEIDKTPVEVFHNNPMQGGDDRLWKTEVYMPIKKQN